MIYDVLNQFVVDSQLSTMREGEKTLLKKGLSSVKENDMLILDRGFGHFCTIKELVSHQTKVCIRLPINSSNFAKNIITHDEDDIITTWEPSPKEVENSRKNKLDATPIKVRIVRIELSSGETELLITNLFDQQKYSARDINELYQLRWGVEEGFKNLKPKMKIEQFGCKKAAGIFQEFYAHIFCMNLVAITGLLASRTIDQRISNRKWKYKYNWKNAYRFVREKLLSFLFNSNNEHFISQILNQVASSIIAIIPDRHFGRDVIASSKKGRITQFNK